ncbi:MAG TPA: glycosyltransferase family 4 protein, partial [Longimicrobium sp.]|nr:glycosyltransferase family 4 protein [Longimicrobium sp.]
MQDGSGTRLRVLLASGVYPPVVGGPSAQTRLLARELMARGVDARVLTWGPESRDAVVDGVPVRYVAAHAAASVAGKARAYRRLYGELRGVLRRFAPHVVHSQTSSGLLPLVTGLAARAHGIPVLTKYTADASEEQAHLRRQGGAAGPARGGRGRTYRAAAHAAQALLFRLSARVWTTTPLFAERVKERFRLPGDRVLLLPNFVDLRPFLAGGADAPPREGSALRLLVVSRLNPIKGVEVCIEAMRHLGDLPATLRIVGEAGVEAEYARYLRRWVEVLGVGDRVAFAGAVPNERIAAEYHRADVLLQGSYYEAFGIALAEAMAAGVPVVATRVGGVPDVVGHGVSGILVPPGEPAAMAGAVRLLAADPGLRERLRDGARARARAFEAGPCVDRLVEEYRRMAGVKRVAPPPALH